jgi:hypothetical protein
MNTPPAKPPHNRKLGLTGVALTKARNRKHDVTALSSVRDELERVIIEDGYLEGAPFSWITISIRFGIKSETEPHFQPINAKYGDLPLAIEVETSKLQSADEHELREIFKAAALKALISAAHRHGRPARQLTALLQALPPHLTSDS